MSAGRRQQWPWFFPAMAIAFLAVAVVGFGPTYLLPMVRGDFDFSIMVHGHAAIMFGWLGLFTLQSLLARRGAGGMRLHMRLHMRLGIVAAILFGLIMISTVASSIASFTRPMPPEVDRLLDNIFFLQLWAFVLSPVLFVLAMCARRTRPQDHKRYMLLLTFFLLEAAASRIRLLPGMGDDATFIYAQYAWLDLLLVPLVVYDLVTTGRLARATIIGGGTLLGYQIIAMVCWDSAWWLSLAAELERILGGA